MSLPSFLQPYLASYNISRLDGRNPTVKNEVITQVLNSGDDQATKWVFKNYSLKEIKEVLSNPQRGVWFKDSLDYWSRLLSVKLPENVYKNAVLELNPNVSKNT